MPRVCADRTATPSTSLLIDQVTRLAGEASDLDADLERAMALIRDAYDHHLVALWELRDDRLVPRAVAVADPRGRSGWSSGRRRSASSARRSARPRRGDELATASDGPRRAVPCRSCRAADRSSRPRSSASDGPWGVLHLVAETPASLPPLAAEVAAVIARTPRRDRRRRPQREDAVGRQLHRAEALRRVAGDIGSRLDLDRILSGLVDHAMVLFEADRGAVFLRHPDGTVTAPISRGLSASFLSSVRDFPANSLPAEAVAAAPSALRRRTIATTRAARASGPPSSRRASTPSARRRCSTAPTLLGLLNVYHDEPHAWTEDDLETMAALATQASVAIRAAQDFERMATWAAQLQSIQQLGTRLNRLSSVQEIGMAIATELRQLIDYHNVRVYRLAGDELIPVAMQGQVGEYVDETPDQLRVAVGEGITGWVAEHAHRPEPRRRRQGPAGQHDPRAPRTTSTSRCCSRR